MRITDGKYQRRHLHGTYAPDLRPTARRLRESLFEFLSPYIRGAHFLDLCAGSGVVGIEALSRHAAHATFVERSPKACGVIEVNLARCGEGAGRAEVLTEEALSFLRRASEIEGRVWDVAFFDPPYTDDYADVLAIFATGAALRRKGGVLVVEHLHDKRLGDTLGVLRRWRVVRRGDSCLSFYQRRR